MGYARQRTATPLRHGGAGATLRTTRKFPVRGPMETMLKGAAPQAAPADLIKDSDQTKFAKDVHRGLAHGRR